MYYRHNLDYTYPDRSLPPREAAKDLRASVYRVVQEMNGIYPGDPTYNEDQTIENYKKPCEHPAYPNQQREC